MSPRVAELLARFETSTHRERVREMIALGQGSTTDPTNTSILAELEGESFYERLLALYGAQGARDGAAVLRNLAGESHLLRRLAAILVPIVCTDEQALAALRNAARQPRLSLARDLRQARRLAVLDAFARERMEASDTAWGKWLPYCSGEFAREWLPKAIERFDADDWRRLARAHPDIVAESLDALLDAQTEPDRRLRWRLNATLPPLSELRPASALALVIKALRHESPSEVPLGHLAEYLPNVVADLLLAHEGSFAVSLSGQVRRLTPERFLALLTQRREYLPAPTSYLPRIPTALRVAAYEQANFAWRDKDGVIAVAVVAALPASIRETEARRHLALPVMQTRPLSRIPYAAFLPPDEAIAVLNPYLKNPDAYLRSAALAARIGTARYHRDTLPDVLRLALGRKNEQDPVRGVLLRALRELPPARWQPEHLDDLGQVIQDALDASDLSHKTGGEAEHLVIALVPFHPEWAALWLAVLVTERGAVSRSKIGTILTDVDVARIAPALLPILSSWVVQEREVHIISAAGAFWSRLRAFTGIAPILESVATSTKSRQMAQSILCMLREHSSERFAALVPGMISADPSIVILSVVHEFLHSRRQDLLTPFLGQKAYVGRFSTGQARFVLPFTSGFHRWTRTQQETFAQTLIRVSRETDRDTPALSTVIVQLAAMPAVKPTRLIELAQTENDKAATRDLALKVLARLDAGQGIPTLVEALTDIRARVAIYALRSALLEMPPSLAFVLLRGAPTDQVTVAKEILRLVGELGTADALPYLLEQAAKPLHRDIRVALLRALWDHIESDDAAAVLLAAASDTDPAVASGVIRIPAERLMERTADTLRAILATLLTHHEPTVRVETLNRCATLPLSDPRRQLLPPLLDRVASPLPDEAGAAASAVFATYGERDADAIGAAITRTLPDRAVLTAVLRVFGSRLNSSRGRLRETTRAVLNALSADPLTARLRAEIALAGLAVADAGASLGALAATNELHAEATMGAVAAAQSRPAREAEVLEQYLAGSGDERLRRVALAALVAVGNESGWDGARRERHGVYCRDTSPLVAAAAQFTLLPPLTETGDPVV